MKLFRRALVDDRGVVAPATAITLAVLLGFVGLVTDVSVWFSQRRDLQGATDAAALGSARFAYNLTNAHQRAQAILVENGVPASDLISTETGVYCPSNVAGAVVFQPDNCPGKPAPAVKNAVRLTTQARGTLLFSRLFNNPRVENRAISVRSTAALINEAGLRAGTGVATLNGGVVNAVLSALTGGSVSLTAIQYEALLSTNVSALPFLDALATRLGVTAGTYDQLLQTDASIGMLLDAAIDVLAKQGNVADAQAAIAGLTAIKGQINGKGNITLGALFDLGVWKDLPVGQSGSSQAALAAGLNVYQLATTSLQVANGSNALALGQTIDVGLAKVSLGTTVIEPPVEPVFGFGPVGTRVHTAQVRTLLRVMLAPILGTSLSSFDIYVEAAGGDAEIVDIACPTAPSSVGDLNTTVTVHGDTGIAAVYLGKVDPVSAMTNFSQPVTVKEAQVANVLGLLKLHARAEAKLGSGSEDMIFVQPTTAPNLSVEPTLTTGVIGRPFTAEAPASPPRAARVTSDDLLTSLGESLRASLVTRLEVLSLDLGGLTDPIVKLLLQVLNGVFALLDPIINELLRALGVQAGYMDTFVTGVRCGVPVLVE